MAIVVFFGGLTTASKGVAVFLEWLDSDRFFGGVDLAIASKAHYLIFSGGKLLWEKGSISEGAFLKRKASSIGISADRILVTKPVQNTEEEALAVKELGGVN